MSGYIETKSRTPGLLILLGIALILAFTYGTPAFAAASETAGYTEAETIASIKESGNVVFYSTNEVRNRLPISLESIRLSATDRVEIIDVRNEEGGFLRFKQNIANGRNLTTILPREPVPVDGSAGLFTVSLHKNLVQKREDTLVFEYDYTPDHPTLLRYTAIIPQSASAESVEPPPKEQTTRRFSWKYELDAGEPFACRIKYTQEAPFGLRLVSDEADIEKLASNTMGYWRDTRMGGGWAWFYKKGLVMPGDFRFSVNVKTIKTINENRRFGIMLDPMDTSPFSRSKSEMKADPWADAWGTATYCFFWSNMDAGERFAYGVLRNGELVASEKAPRIREGKGYEVALEKEAQQFRFFVDGKQVFEYADPELLWSRHPLRIGVHGSMSGQEIKEFHEKNQDWWKGHRSVKARQKAFDNLKLAYIGYRDRKFTLIGADKKFMELRSKYFEPVDSIDTFSPSHIFSAINPILKRLNDFDEWDFSPSDSANLDEVADIDLSRLGFRKISTSPLKEVTIGKVHFEVPPEQQSISRLVSYARKGSDEPVLFIEMGQAPSEFIADQVFGGIREQTNWGTWNGMNISQAFYPHLSSMGMRKGRWLIHVSLPLEEGESSELEGKWDTIRLFMRRIGGEILMHFYEMDMNAQ